ncbi:hypothetical protein PCASD_17275 [Puccinia coronata f. sp. avenae]|uniref:Uncharacterized protein n=1 Tax=Puccinia coronata f. sp. avenae TaxID=200324 RepID=A0A2N5U987_9BASI|nr:hypothetical protein PCASD_17275 [Puccinia coronata f. sp. avenae]
MILLKKKWTAYNNQASNYNLEFTPETELETPTFDEIKQFGIKNTFWNSGWLDHPNKAWAVDLDTQKGIQAYLTITHCQDELHRIAREARQAKLKNPISFLTKGNNNLKTSATNSTVPSKSLV